MKSRYLSIVVLVCVLGGALTYCKASEHTVRVIVRDAETGVPLEGATVLFQFTRAQAPGHGWGFAPPVDIERKTNAQGRAQASGRVPREAGEIWFNVEAEGFYGGGDLLEVYDAEGEKIVYDELVIALRPKRNPQAMYARRFVQTAPLVIPVANEDIGFDLQRSDWLPPHGDGEHADIIFNMDIGEKHGEMFPEDRGMMGILVDVKVSMRFPDGGGVITLSGEDLPASVFRWPYEAPENGYEPKYKVIWHRVDKEQPNDRNHSWQVHENQRFIFRTRPVSVEGGGEREFHYGRIHEPPRLHFADRRNNLAEIGVSFSYTFNPIPGERSMEFDVSRNLFEGSGLVPSQYLGGFQP